MHLSIFFDLASLCLYPVVPFDLWSLIPHTIIFTKLMASYSLNHAVLYHNNNIVLEGGGGKREEILPIKSQTFLHEIVATISKIDTVS